jgi:hypothetical protein
MRPFFLLLILLSAAAARDAPPPADSSGPPKQSAPAPFHLTIAKDLPLLCAGIASTGAAFVLERSLEPLTRDEADRLSRDAVNRFDRSATFRYSPSADRAGDIVTCCLLTSPLGLLADRKLRGSAGAFSALYAETVMLAYALPSLGKALFKRPRPFVYNPAVPPDKKMSRDARVSFFSRHTTLAFASACFLSTVYGANNPGSKLAPCVWFGSLGAASTVGFLRFAAGAHFPTDVLTGALAGTLVGCGVPYLHTSGSEAAGISLNPSGSGLCLSLRW